MKLLNPFFYYWPCLLLFLWDRGTTGLIHRITFGTGDQGTVEALFYDASLNSTSTVGTLPVAELINYLDITDERLEKEPFIFLRKYYP